MFDVVVVTVSILSAVVSVVSAFVSWKAFKNIDSQE